MLQILILGGNLALEYQINLQMRWKISTGMILREKEKDKLKLLKDPKLKTYNKILKMDQEKKYKKANEDIKNDKETCKKIQEKILDIEQELKNNVISTKLPKQILSNKHSKIPDNFKFPD